MLQFSLGHCLKEPGSTVGRSHASHIEESKVPANKFEKSSLESQNLRMPQESI